MPSSLCVGYLTHSKWVYFAMTLIISQLMQVYCNHQPYNEKDYDEHEAGTSFFLKKEFSLSKPYPGPWDFGGSTLVQPGLVRLTPDQQSVQGWIRCTVPVAMRNWEVHVNFKVHGSTGHLFGDGLAFWYTEPSMQFGGPVFGNRNKFRGLGVFLDTYSNHNGPHSHDHPYLSAMIGNGSVEYDHDRDGTHSQVAGCSAKFRNRDHDTHVAISYVANTLTVSTDVENKGEWERCFAVPNVQLPTHYVFALSAMTGQLSDTHDILSVKVYEVDSAEIAAAGAKADVDYRNVEPFAGAAEPQREHVDQPSGGGGYLWKSVLIVLLSLALLAGVAVGAFAYHRRQQRQRKRFY